MVVADFILAWSALLAALGYAGRVLAGESVERFARGVFRTHLSHRLR